MFDVGGQRSERKKWIHVFDNVQVVLFLVAISGYDHVLVEDRNGVSWTQQLLTHQPVDTQTDSSQNQMQEALMLFESIANSKYFEKSALILFLNKIDLFREKVTSGKSPIREHFPDYTGADKDIDAGQDFFARKFKNLVRDPGKEAYVHFTNATDTNLLDKTMKSVQDMIVQRNLHQLMLWAPLIPHFCPVLCFPWEGLSSSKRRFGCAFMFFVQRHISLFICRHE
jgi:guanine nucleotide-binding protein subunit alpha